MSLVDLAAAAVLATIIGGSLGAIVWFTVGFVRGWRRAQARPLVRIHLERAGSPAIDPGPSSPTVTLEGLLIERTAGHYLLRGASLLEQEGEPVTLAGEVLIPRERVVFYQVVHP